MPSPIKPRVALVSGFWGQNIGNAFFNIGGKWVLDQIFGPDNVAFIQDQPGYRTFHNQRHGNPINDIGFLKYLDIDYVVMQGPLFTATLLNLWGETLDVLASRGTKILLVGAAFFKYRPEELVVAAQFMARYPLTAISTRDTISYNKLKSLNTDIPLYDGLDSAFFAPNAYRIFALDLQNYAAFNFDRYPEPTFRVGNEALPDADAHFSYRDEVWNLYTPTFVSRLTHGSKVQAYLGHLMDRRKMPTEVAGMQIIRPEHRTNPHMTYKIYQHPNAIASDEPWTYFNVYGNADLVLADRVHACVAALAYGKSAMLFTPSPRQALFARVGATDIRQRPVQLSKDLLENEAQNELDWLRSRVS